MCLGLSVCIMTGMDISAAFSSSSMRTAVVDLLTLSISLLVFTCTNELLIGCYCYCWDCWLRGSEEAIRLFLWFLLLKGIWLPEGVIGGSWFKKEWFALFRGWGLVEVTWGMLPLRREPFEKSLIR